MKNTVKGRIRWNEANLNEIEANKPVRQKITEPKTPYHHMVDEDGTLMHHLVLLHYQIDYVKVRSPARDFNSLVGNAEHADAIRSALNNYVSTSTKAPQQCAGWASEDEADAMEQDDEDFDADSDELSFKEQRRAHYNEFWTVKELLQKGSFFDDEDEDEDGKEQMEDRCDPCSSLMVGIKAMDVGDKTRHESQEHT
ncbi:hypothetical protein ACLOJK_006197 [Asimina triloba]